MNGYQTFGRKYQPARRRRIHLDLWQAQMSARSRNTAPAKAQQDDMTKIVEKHGSLFRLSDAAYRRLLTLIIAGTKYDLWELGRCIGCVHASLGSFDRDDAEFELARLDVPLPTAAPNSSNRRR